MQALTPDLLAEATARMLAQLPLHSAVLSSLPGSSAVFPPVGHGFPVSSAFPSTSSPMATASQVSAIGTPSRPSETPALPRAAFAAHELPNLFLPPLTTTVPSYPHTQVPAIPGGPLLGGPFLTEGAQAAFANAAAAQSEAPGESRLSGFPDRTAPSEKSAGGAIDGLKAFIGRIQAGQFHEGGDRCGQEDEVLNRLRRSLQQKQVQSARPLVFNVQEIRRDFPALHQKVNNHDLVWFDNAATTQKPIQVINALTHFYSNNNSNIHRAAHTLAARATDAYEGTRNKIQRQLGATSPDEIVFVRGTTEGINLVAWTFGRAYLQAGDEIVLSELEHHANIVPWQLVARERGAVIRVIPVNDKGEVLLHEYQRLLGPKTRIVALTQASNSLGTILPVAEMSHMARRVGAKVLIDGAQSISHMPVSVNAIGCDFFVFSGHKIFGPTGIGALYIRRELQEILPPWQSGGNMIRNVTFEETTFAEPPAKFEAGTPNIADAVALGTALDYVNEIGLHNIGQYEHSLLHYATEQLSMINGLRIIGTAREKVSVVSFLLGDMPAEKTGQHLDKHGIAVRSGHHCAQPSLRRFGVEATVRPSFAFYNTIAEIDYLVDVLRTLRRKV